jgi:hypothetical protein
MSASQAPITFGRFDPKVDSNPSDENLELIMSIDFYQKQNSQETNSQKGQIN